jgi:Dyp-type peroxidase family
MNDEARAVSSPDATHAGADVDYADVQGLVRFGFGKMKEAAYAHLRVKDPAAARAWLRGAPVTNAVATTAPPPVALQVAFTAPGLEALGVAPSVVGGFSAEFLAGMAEENRSRRLGDVGPDAPSQWQWGYEQGVPHVMAMFFAEPGGLDAFVRDVKSDAWSAAFEAERWHGTADLDGVEPFGFADGISQPAIDWNRTRDVHESQIDFTNIVALGEFLLGYPNEYDKYTDRPLLDAGAPGAAGLLDAEDAPGRKDLGRNGTYLVMRQLRQDVRRFWQYLHAQSGGDRAVAESFAAAFVGRTRDGDPLVPISAEPIPGIGPDPDEVRQNRFTFAGDVRGTRCPFGAHVRRQNPRNADLPARETGLAKVVTMLGFGPGGFRDDLMSPVRFHRILRRGREYGPGLSPDDALTPPPPDEAERGLHFICLNASISRQFEFLQNAWTSSSKFSGLTGESDPLLGNRAPLLDGAATGDFTIPRDGLRRRLGELPRFVTVRGGAYFFLPSLRALRYIARD